MLNGAGLTCACDLFESHTCTPDLFLEELCSQPLCLDPMLLQEVSHPLSRVTCEGLGAERFRVREES